MHSVGIYRAGETVISVAIVVGRLEGVGEGTALEVQTGGSAAYQGN